MGSQVIAMKMTFRWFGKSDPVTLQQIRQIPCMSGIVSAVYDVKAGGVWSSESIAAIKSQADLNHLSFEVVESVPVHEDIKLGNKNAAKYIENYCENIRRLGASGVKVICYNFMPVFDWLRSELEFQNEDGSHALAYVHDRLLKMDPKLDELQLPGWDAGYTREELKALLSSYAAIDEKRLWRNLESFLKAVVPVAEKSGVKMAIHPDDPPWGIFGLPRIITGDASFKKLSKLINSEANGLTFCTGSLGASTGNDLVKMAAKYADRIYFAHLRNIRHLDDKSFVETAHPTRCGSLDMYRIAKALTDNGFEGYVRPDHGRMIWGETGRYGYGLFDRALGATYLTGLFEAIEEGESNP
jgi:mannonate dehydratase